MANSTTVTPIDSLTAEVHAELGRGETPAFINAVRTHPASKVRTPLPQPNKPDCRGPYDNGRCIGERVLNVHGTPVIDCPSAGRGECPQLPPTDRVVRGGHLKLVDQD